jgi:pimeloyl-ACP methyl ester carboxylesterase
MHFSITTKVFLALSLLSLVGCAEEGGAPSTDDGPNIIPRDAGNGDDDDDVESPNTARPVASEFTITENEARTGYKYRRYVFRHQAEHGKSKKLTVTQHVEVMVPNGVKTTDNVYLLLDHGADSTIERLEQHTGLPRFFGSRFIYIIAEHRGYGQSLSDDTDQSIPTYVTHEQAVLDAHEVIKALKKEFTGKWQAFGYGYGGSLVTELAAKYPTDADVFVASSAVIEWPAVDDTREGYIRNRLGGVSYDRAVAHLAALKPTELFRSKWETREAFESLLAASAQQPWSDEQITSLRVLLGKTTEEVVDGLSAIDKSATDGEATTYAKARGMESLTRAQALASDISGRTFFFQQCSELGGLYISPVAGGLFGRAPEDHSSECGEQFGRGNVMDIDIGRTAWDLSDEVLKIGEKGANLIYVRGGRDPGQDYGLRAPNWAPRVTNAKSSVYDVRFGSYLDVPAGYANPDLNDTEVGLVLWGEVARLLAL